MNSRRVRRAAVAGRFYPADPQELRAAVARLLAETESSERFSAKAIVAPHAGYMFSGAVAASAYSRFGADAQVIKRVVVLGPSHFVPCAIALSSAEAFETPLGEVAVDVEAVKAVGSLPGCGYVDEAHEREHAIEVQLPFLQVVLPTFKLVPVVLGKAEVGAVAAVLDALWGGPETRFVVSSDLSHYLDSGAARKLDAQTSAAIERLDYESLDEYSACGVVALNGLLHAASRHGLKAHLLDLRNSADRGGPKDRVVGYGAFAFGSN